MIMEAMMQHDLANDVADRFEPAPRFAFMPASEELV